MDAIDADALITWLVLGDCRDVPKWGRLNVMPRCEPGTPNLYNARRLLIDSVRTRYFCMLDGGEDRLLPAFSLTVMRLLERMEHSGAPIGYADEQEGHTRVVSGPYARALFLRHPQMIHHGVVCRTDAARRIKWPDGNYLFEVVCYGSLAEQGFEYLPEPIYQWNPTPGGARTWPDCARAQVNALLWLDRKQPVNFAHEYRFSPPTES